MAYTFCLWMHGSNLDHTGIEFPVGGGRIFDRPYLRNSGFLLDQKDSSMKNIWFEFCLQLELLALCMEAGLDFTSSLIEITQIDSTSFVSQKLKILSSAIHLGKTKQQALGEFQKSWSHPMIENFCQTLLYGWQNGISLSGLLKQMASSIRTTAYFKLEKEIQKKNLKLLLPLFMCILPSVFLILMIPLFVQLFSIPW